MRQRGLVLPQPLHSAHLRVIAGEIRVRLELIIPAHFTDSAELEIAIGDNDQVTHLHARDKGRHAGDAVIRCGVRRHNACLGKSLLDMLARATACEVNRPTVTQQHIATGQALLVNTGVLTQGIAQRHFPDTPLADLRGCLSLLCHLRRCGLAERLKHPIHHLIAQLPAGFVSGSP